MIPEEQRDMLIRHDEQLRSLVKLPDAVNELSKQIRDLADSQRVSRTRTDLIRSFVNIAWIVGTTVMTWIIAIHWSH